MLLNANSPTVQAMLQNTPQGFGNMPMYYGNAPTAYVQQQAQPQQFNSPFPSPKDMLTSAGQANVYAPTGFGYQQPPMFMGGNTSIMNGYQNPFMGYGYSGYTTPYPANPYSGNIVPNYNRPMTEQEFYSIQSLKMSGLNVHGPIEMRQLEIQGEISAFKALSRLCGKVNDLSEEEIEERQALYDSKPVQQEPPPQESYKRKFDNPLVVTIDKGDGTTIKLNSAEVMAKNPYENYYTNGCVASNVERNAQIRNYYAVLRFNQLFDSAPERKYDDASMYDMFNGGGLADLYFDSLRRLEHQQALSRTGKLYDGSAFQSLLSKCGLSTRGNSAAIRRLTGRYGIMPDGRPVSPQHDPSIASSFAFNQNTGEFEITPPNFIARRLEKARSDFYRTIDGGADDVPF